MKDPVHKIIKRRQLTFPSKPIKLENMSSISLFICDGIQQEADYVRRGFVLLQQPLDPEVIKLFSSSSPELLLCLKLNRRTPIITAVNYLLSDEVEEMAAIAGKTFTFEKSLCMKNRHSNGKKAHEQKYFLFSFNNLGL